LSLHFFDFSMIFYEFSKFQLELIHYLRSYFRTGPWDFLVHTTIPLVHIKDPGKTADLAIGSSAMVGVGLAEITAVRRRSWPGKWSGMTTSSRGSIYGRGWGGNNAGEPTRRSPAAAAAEATAPARGRRDRNKERVWEL
jgi:hypothetical protein